MSDDGAHDGAEDGAHDGAPRAPGPAGPHRRRRGRRTAAYVAGAAALVAVLGIAVPAALGHSGLLGLLPERPITGDAVPGDFACADRSSDRSRDATLEPGAVAVRICAPDGRRQEPVDALASGADEIARMVNDIEERDHSDGPCTLDHAPPWHLTFQYADGTTRSITGETAGCGGIRVGPVGRGGRAESREVIARFHEAIRDQRATSAPPADVPTAPLPCRPAGDDTALSERPDTSLLGGGLADAAVLTLCRRSAETGGDWWVTQLAPDQVAALAAAAREDVSAPAPERCPTWTNGIMLTGRTSWGDGFVVPSQCGAFGWGEPWRPSGDSLVLLADLVRAGRPSEQPLVAP